MGDTFEGPVEMSQSLGKLYVASWVNMWPIGTGT